MLYTTVKIGNKEYKCRLNTKAFVELEKRLGTNPLNIFADLANSGNTVPSLGVMLDIFHASLQAFEHGISLDDTYELYDKYIENGGDFVSFMNEIVNIIQNSGILPKDKRAEEEEKEAKN